ncbi:FAD-dependent oxidoreductase [Streptomyces sp. DH37]|uniref:NAD(P)/FAD-dependent oxidoreductase n=1 Tax=Streptomyces sp. DH37 TaxID=3040122 RepID=UPI002441A4A2|nr:FAD-dependent oxidoreductase [Streptomyces sp. DH37]MDG9702069.1 FAD-dependent oxidoreductase [Streptomyces sp. DH37]
MRPTTHAVVLGGGLAGTLAAAALARHVDEVTVVERDVMPDGPEPRRGVPQARHSHLLWCGGARAIEALLPGTTEALLAAGAHRVGLPSGLVLLTAHGWMPRWPETHFMISSSRDLLDSTVRRQVLGRPGVTLRQGVRAVGPVGTAERITGVRVRDERSGETFVLEADFVVDATGRASRADRWLAGLGLPAVREETVDSGLAYATRVFRAPPAAGKDFPVITLQADPRDGQPGRGAALLPIEGDRWLVTLSGTRGGEPPTDEERFHAFARGLRSPVVAELIEDAEPLTPVHGSHGTANRRRYFERLDPWPDGFAVLGDAVAAYNPVYGQGMSVLAHGAVLLDRILGRHGLRPGTARRVQRAVAGPVDGAWQTAVGQDVQFPDVAGPSPSAVDRLLLRYLDRLVRTATSRPAAAEAFLEAITLSGPMTRLVGPKALLTTLLGPRRPAPAAPTLTADERSRARGAGATPEVPDTV